MRVGNGAAGQHQLDGYGWVIDAAWVLVQAGHRLYSETWRAVRGFADLVARRWQEPDAGIWEIRGDAAHHVHSKLMGWLALDRALRIADTHRLSAPATATVAGRTRRHRRRGPGTRLRPGDGAATSAATAPPTWTRPCSSCRCWAWTSVESPRVRGTIDAIRDRAVRRRPAALPLPAGT